MYALDIYAQITYSLDILHADFQYDVIWQKKKTYNPNMSYHVVYPLYTPYPTPTPSPQHDLPRP